MDEWEYEKATFVETDPGEILSAMNNMGKNRWELCSQSAMGVTGTKPDGTTIQAMMYVYWFKRRKSALVVPKELLKTHG